MENADCSFQSAFCKTKNILHKEHFPFPPTFYLLKSQKQKQVRSEIVDTSLSASNPLDGPSVISSESVPQYPDDTSSAHRITSHVYADHRGTQPASPRGSNGSICLLDALQTKTSEPRGKSNFYRLKGEPLALESWAPLNKLLGPTRAADTPALCLGPSRQKSPYAQQPNWPSEGDD